MVEISKRAAPHYVHVPHSVCLLPFKSPTFMVHHAYIRVLDRSGVYDASAFLHCLFLCATLLPSLPRVFCRPPLSAVNDVNQKEHLLPLTDLLAANLAAALAANISAAALTSLAAPSPPPLALASLPSPPALNNRSHHHPRLAAAALSGIDGSLLFALWRSCI